MYHVYYNCLYITTQFVVLVALFAAAIAAELPTYSKPSYPAEASPAPDAAYPTPASAAYPTPALTYAKETSEKPAYSKPAEENHV